MIVKICKNPRQVNTRNRRFWKNKHFSDTRDEFSLNFINYTHTSYKVRCYKFDGYFLVRSWCVRVYILRHGHRINRWLKIHETVGVLVVGFNISCLIDTLDVSLILYLHTYRNRLGTYIIKFYGNNIVIYSMKHIIE